MASEYILPLCVDRSHRLRQRWCGIRRSRGLAGQNCRRVISPCGAPVFQSDDRTRPGHPAELERRRLATAGGARALPAPSALGGLVSGCIRFDRHCLPNLPRWPRMSKAAGIQSHVSTTHDIMESQDDITTLLGSAVIGSGRVPVSGHQSIPETTARMCSRGPIVDGGGPHRTQGGVVAQPRRLTSHRYQEAPVHSLRTSSYDDRWRSSG